MFPILKKLFPKPRFSMACLFAGDKSLMATELSGMVKLQRNLNRHLSNSNLLCSLYDAVCSFIGASKYQAGKSQIVSQTQGTVSFVYCEMYGQSWKLVDPTGSFSIQPVRLVIQQDFFCSATPSAIQAGRLPSFSA